MAKAELGNLKGTLSPWKKISYKKDITFLNTVKRFKNSNCPPFTPKLADLAENVRLKGAEKKAVSLRNGPEKQAVGLRNGLEK